MNDIIVTSPVERTVFFEGAFYTEGPVRDKLGRYYFTDLSGGRVWRMSPEGRSLKVWATSTCPNGQAITREGHHLICDSKEHVVKRFDAKGRLIRYEVNESCAGIPVHVPNDVIVDRSGGFYFTDSVREDGRVFYKSSAGNCHEVAQGYDYPNGLVLSTDERYLFIAESYRNRILRITLDKPGRMGYWEVWCDLPQHPSGTTGTNLPDGLAMDGMGRLWVAHYGMGAVQVVGTDGKLLASVATGLPLTSNVCLIDDITLLVTGGITEPGPGAVARINVRNITEKIR